MLVLGLEMLGFELVMDKCLSEVVLGRGSWQVKIDSDYEVKHFKRLGVWSALSTIRSAKLCYSPM